MSFGLTLGQMAAGFKGAVGAMEQMGKANLANEEIEYQRKERQYQTEERDRQRRDRERQDALQKELSQIPETVTEDVKNPAAPQVDDSDDPANATPSAASLPAPKTRTATLDERLRQAANAYKRAGQFDNYLKFTADADKVAFNRAAQAFEQFDAGSEGLDALSYIKQTAEIFSNDPFAGKVENIRQNPDGSVSFDSVNTSTGQRFQRTVKSVDEARNQLRAYYSPETFAKLQESRAKSLSELTSERSKPYSLRPGEMRVDPVSGKTTKNDIGFINIGTDENPQYVRSSSTGTSGSGSKGGKTAADPAKAAADIVMDQATKGEIKLQPNQISDAQMRAAQIASRGVPEFVAANVAIKVAQDPTLLKPRLDPKTGMIDNVYEDPSLGEVVVDKGYSEARRPVGVTKQDLEKFAGQLVEAQPEAVRAELIAASFDPVKARDLQNKVVNQITSEFNAHIQKNPNAKAQIEAQRDAYIQSTLQSLSRKRDLIYGHYPKPKDPATANAPRAAAAPARSQEPYVPPPGSPAARSAAAREAERQRLAGGAQQSVNNATAISKQFAADAQTMPPLELVRKYDSMRGSLSREELMKLREIERRL